MNKALSTTQTGGHTNNVTAAVSSSYGYILQYLLTLFQLYTLLSLPRKKEIIKARRLFVLWTPEDGASTFFETLGRNSATWHKVPENVYKGGSWP
jgi:hypothetical protein